MTNRQTNKLTMATAVQLIVSRFTSILKYELAISVNEEFPHIYGIINLDAVIKTYENINKSDGLYKIEIG